MFQKSTNNWWFLKCFNNLFLYKNFLFWFCRWVINEKYRLITEKLCSDGSVGYALLARTNKSKSNMCRTFNYSTHLFETCYFNLFVEWFSYCYFSLITLLIKLKRKFLQKLFEITSEIINCRFISRTFICVFWDALHE